MPSPCWPGTTPPSWWPPSWTSPHPWTGTQPHLPSLPPSTLYPPPGRGQGLQPQLWPPACPFPAPWDPHRPGCREGAHGPALLLHMSWVGLGEALLPFHSIVFHIKHPCPASTTCHLMERGPGTLSANATTSSSFLLLPGTPPPPTCSPVAPTALVGAPGSLPQPSHLS